MLVLTYKTLCSLGPGYRKDPLCSYLPFQVLHCWGETSDYPLGQKDLADGYLEESVLSSRHPIKEFPFT